MRLLKLAPFALLLAAASGCTCADTVRQTRFACQDTSECLAGFTCRGGECRSDEIPAGECAEGSKETCAIASCERVCNSDGGWSACAPSTGPGFERDPNNCGECGRRCSTRLGDSLTCIAGRCTCVHDADCPSGDVCLTGGVCGLNTDPCAGVSCAAGSVCRGGACAPVTCAAGCKAGEVCEVASGNCRPILPCHFAAPCPDGGICESGAQPDGEPCNDGVACTAGDSCRAGTCSGTAYSCPAPGPCQQAVACAGDGGCEVTPALDGTPCDDGVSCTHSDQCLAGACNGTGYTCSPNQCAATSECAGDGGCNVTPRNIGAACDDGQGCTFGDFCGDAGTCLGTTYTCPGVTQCKEAGLCLGDGGCDVVNKANGTPCNDGLACTGTDVCASGVCSGTAVTSYQDSDGDGRGTSAVTQTSCPLSAGYVLDAGDCNDSSALVYDTMPAAADLDQDGVTATTTLTTNACVGATSVISGRTYYRSSTGAYSWLAAASPAADCNDADPDIFETRPSMVTDVDHDGHSVGSASTTCVGASSVINGRTCYANAAGAFVYLDTTASLGADCLDTNATVFTSRSVALDTDHDGFTTTTTTATQCTGASSVINTRTYFADTAGAFNWLGTASAAADCNDANAAITGTATYYPDVDGDTFGAASSTGNSRCMPLAGEVPNNTDCDDGNAFINTLRMVAKDADQDSFTLTTTLSSQCTGASGTAVGRTYYRDAANALSWLGSASTTVDCDDANATVFPQTYYPDTDGDGFGAATGGQVQCPRSGSFVANNSDCNDTVGSVFQSIALLYDDADQDGYSNAVAATFCVGSTQTVGGRTYYRSSAGTFNYTTTNLGADCSSNNAALFTSRANVVRDNDRDGYPASLPDSTQCTGATSTVGTRTYFSDGAGGYWMGRADCIQRSGANCNTSFVDCYDQNAAANYTQTGFFTADRGDGSYDYDCTNGSVVANTTATFCASTSANVTVYTDSSCAMTSGTATICNSPTAFALPAACGKNTAGAGTFTFGTMCSADTIATGTQVGCR